MDVDRITDTNGKTATLNLDNSNNPATGNTKPPRTTQGRLKINIVGRRYEVMLETLIKYPSTRLGKIALGKINSSHPEDTPAQHPLSLYDEFDSITGEFYFERNPTSFPLVISYYKTDTLHIPHHVCVELFQEEMEYWGIPFHPNTCCQGYHQQEWEMMEAVRKTDEIFETKAKTKSSNLLGSDMNSKPIPKITIWKERIWDLFENSETSNAAYIVSIVSSLMVIISTMTLCLNTLPNVRTNLPNGKHIDNPILVCIEIVCITWFTIEYGVRIFSCPNKLKFLLSIMNTIDLLAILPFYIGLLIENLNGGIHHNFTDARRFVQILRIFRIVRIFKVARHSTGLQVLGYTVRNSGSELSLLLLLLMMGMTLFSSLVYYAEEEVEGTKFTSIIAAFWWAIITMTTVGYGDVVPVTLMGQIVGSMCCISGILFIALPIPTIVSNFSAFYKDHLNKHKFHKLYHIDEEDDSLASSDSMFPTASLKSIYASALQSKIVSHVERHENYRRRFSSFGAASLCAGREGGSAGKNRVYPLPEEDE